MLLTNLAVIFRFVISDAVSMNSDTGGSSSLLAGNSVSVGKVRKLFKVMVSEAVYELQIVSVTYFPPRFLLRYLQPHFQRLC